jgi:hypothetical protein
MLQRSEAKTLSKNAVQRVACGKAGVIPPNKKHTERLAKLKKNKKDRDAAEAAYEEVQTRG